MHLCFITHEYPILNLPHGGIGTFVRTLSYKLWGMGVKISVIRITDTKEASVIDDHGIQVHIIPQSTSRLAFLANYSRVNACISKIHAMEPIHAVETAELGLAFIKKIPGINYIIRMHGGHHYFAKAENRPLEWKKTWMEKRSFKKADHVLACSHYVADTTRELLALPSLEVTVIYNPIDTKKFYKCDPAKTEPYTILFAGSLVEKKGIRQLVQSLEFLIPVFPSVKLYIAGRMGNIPGTSQSYESVLMKAITPDIAKHIKFLGMVPNTEMVTYIEKAQVCCYPSHMEAMPLAWLEVLAMGKAFIGGSLGPGPEAVIDGDTGLLADPKNPKDIAAKITYAFEHTEVMQAMGVKARDRVIQTFDVEVIAVQNYEFYDKITQQTNVPL
jgi:glycosyltransferase involved in cell wall biosynthesis